MTFKTVSIQAFAMVFVALLAITGYHVLFAKSVAIRTIDLTEIMTAIQTKYLKQLENKNLSTDERKRLNDELDGFGPKIQAAINDVTQSCACVIVVRQAVVNNMANDITDTIKARIQL